MSEYNWCHGPKCHERRTTTRVRGVKGSKVLRTIKINVNNNYRNGLFRSGERGEEVKDFMWKYYQEFINLHPRTEALETPIEDPKKVRPYENAQWFNWEIQEVDNNSNP
jgi:hypothetical protein